jgi:hypothetical protein
MERFCQNWRMRGHICDSLVTQYTSPTTPTSKLLDIHRLVDAGINLSRTRWAMLWGVVRS